MKGSFWLQLGIQSCIIFADSADLWRSSTSNNGSVGTSYEYTRRTNEYHAPGISSPFDVHTAASITGAFIHSRCCRGYFCTAVHGGWLGVAGFVAINRPCICVPAFPFYVMYSMLRCGYICPRFVCTYDLDFFLCPHFRFFVYAQQWE